MKRTIGNSAHAGKPRFSSRLTALVLALVLCFNPMLAAAAHAAGDAMGLSEVAELLNSVELHPQPTGYAEMDRLLAERLEPYEREDNFTKLKAMYDWLVENVSYSWEGYSQNHAPAYDKFTLTYNLTYESDQPEAFPREIINRSYHTLTAKKGVCYDYAALYAVMARYIGVESYVHTGILKKGSWHGHHGWTELRINGTNYIFDPQQDLREMEQHRDSYAHFGIAPASSGRYTPETEANAARDKGFLPLTAESVPAPSPEPELAPEPSPPDVVSEPWYQAVVRAAQAQGLLTMEDDVVAPGGDPASRAWVVRLLARLDGTDLTRYSGSAYADVPPDSPDAPAIAWASQNGIVTGEDDMGFHPDAGVTREQLLTILMRYVTAVRRIDIVPAELPYSDAGEISAYARSSVEQAEAAGLVAGTGGGVFQPQRGVTQAEALTFLVRLGTWLSVQYQGGL